MKRPVKMPILTIIQNNEKVDIIDVLKLLEYSILNRNKVEAGQETVVFEREYHGPFETQTLPEAMIDSILRQPVSATVSKVLSNRIYRKEIDKEFTQISYYAQNGKFYICRDDWPNKEPLTIQEFDHIWQFSPVRYSEFVGTTTAIVFDTPDTFRYIDAAYSNPAYVSPRHSIGDGSVAMSPCVVRALGSKLVSIVHKGPPMIGGRDRTMIYLIPRDSLILNLEKLLGEWDVETY